MSGHNRVRWVLQAVVGFAMGLSGALAVSCTGESPRAVCVKLERSCDLHADDDCEEADECVPAEEFGADAVTDCEDGQCVWDCTGGEACPAGWRCQEQRPTLVELISGC